MEQFTKKAASALKLAAKAARRRNHSYIGSEHLLLGLLEEGEGTAAQVLIGAGVEEEKLKSLIDQLIAPEGGVGLASREGYTPRASAILENSVREAELFHMEQAGTEHILITIIKDPECVATGRESPEALPGHSGQHGHPGGGLPGDEPGSQKCKPE